MVVTEKENKGLPVHLESLTKTTKTALTVQHVLLHQIRRILDDEGFIEVLAPLTSLDDKSSKKPLSEMTIYKQTLIRTFERIYALAPIVKEEFHTYTPSSRQLYESYQLELEMRNQSLYDMIETTENFLERLLEIVALICSNVLEECDRKFIVPSIPFPKITYTELHELASKFDYSFNFGEEIPIYVKEEVSNNLRKPIWVIDYPMGSSKVPYRENPYQPGFSASADLLYPKGFGEAASGGERLKDVSKIIDFLKSSGERIDEYQVYLDMMETDGKNSAGIAIGIEPLLKYVLG